MLKSAKITKAFNFPIKQIKFVLMNTGKKPTITLPGAICSICNTPFDKCDMKNHVKSFLASYGQVIRAKKDKELAWKNRKGTAKKSNRLSHNKLIRELKIKEQDLPPVLKLLILNLEIDKALLKQDGHILKYEAEKSELQAGSDAISVHIKRFLAKEVIETPPYLNILIINAGRKLFALSTDENSPESLLHALARPHGLIFKAKELAESIAGAPVESAEYSHCIDLAEKSAVDRLNAIAASRAEEPEPAPFVSPAEDKIKRDYIALLEKNIVPIAEFVKKERQKMRDNIQAFLKLNTTSVFTYTYDESTEELTGRIADITTKVIQFKK